MHIDDLDPLRPAGAVIYRPISGKYVPVNNLEPFDNDLAAWCFIKTQCPESTWGDFEVVNLHRIRYRRKAPR